MISDHIALHKTARHEVQLPTYYIHFGIAQLNRPNTGLQNKR